MSSHIHNLLLKSCSGSIAIPLHVIEFLSETVAATIEEDLVLSHEDATTLLLDAGFISSM